MIKKEFSIACSSDGSVVLSEAPFFNKMESGVTKLSFTLPDLEGFAYLMCRHDRKEWYAIPILTDDSGSYVMAGQTITSQHGRWAFNVCVCEKELINVEQQDGVIYMSDVFEGLVYDNIVDKTPAAMEPNVLKLGNEFRYLYEELKGNQDVFEQDLERAEGAVVNLEAAVERARAYADLSTTKAGEADASAADATEQAEKAAGHQAKCDQDVADAERWARDSFTSSEVSRAQVREANYYAGEAEESAQKSLKAWVDAKELVEHAKILAGANVISYDANYKILSIFNNDEKLSSCELTDLIRSEEAIRHLNDEAYDINSRLITLDGIVEGLARTVGTANEVLSQLL